MTVGEAKNTVAGDHLFYPYGNKYVVFVRWYVSEFTPLYDVAIVHNLGDTEEKVIARGSLELKRPT